MPCCQEYACDALRVGYLSAENHVDRCEEWHPNDPCSSFLMAHRCADSGFEVLAEEESDSLVGESDGGPDLGEIGQASRHVADLLFELSLSRSQGVGRLGVELSGGDFEHRSFHRGPILFDQQNVATDERNNTDGAWVIDDDAFDDLTARDLDIANRHSKEAEIGHHS